MNKSQRFAAHLFLCYAFVLASRSLPAAAQSSQSNTLELLRHIASLQGQSIGNVFVGRLPNEPVTVPLPRAPILGSVVSRYIPPAYGSPSTEIYYDGDAADLTHYDSSLSSAGWTRKELPFEQLHRGGFQSAPTLLSRLYCSGKGQIYVSVAPDSRDLRVTLYSGPIGNTMCEMKLPAELAGRMQNPLPALTAPIGVAMNVSSAGNPAGSSGAILKGAKSVSALMDSFSAEFTSAGWSAGPASKGLQIASQSFHFNDKMKQSWQAVLTLYTVDGMPNTTIAFVDVTNVATLR